MKDEFTAPKGRPLYSKYVVKKVVRNGHHGFWVHCKSSDHYGTVVFHLEPGSDIPNVGSEFDIIFSWNNTTKA